MRLVLSFTLACWLCGCSEASKSEREVWNVVKRMRAAYAELESYESKVQVVSASWNGEKKYEKKTTVSVRMKKPDLFRLNWREEPQKHSPLPPQLAHLVPVEKEERIGAAWHDGSGSYYFSKQIDRFRKCKSPGMALAPATVASTLPKIFSAKRLMAGNVFSGLKAPELLAEETVDGERCHVLSGLNASSNRVLFWISKEDHLIRRYVMYEETPSWKLDPPPEGEESAESLPVEGGIMDQVASMALDRLRVETYSNIEFPALNADDFSYSPPGNLEMTDASARNSR